jgi:glycine reductase
MTDRLRVVHYLNQFFAGLGGEEAANQPPVWFDGPRGPGQLIARLAPELEVVGTLAAGDNYVAENLDRATGELLTLLREQVAGQKVDALLAGPAFNAGRYGLACCALCEQAQSALSVPAVAGLFADNPAVESYRGRVTLVQAGEDVMDMTASMRRLVQVAVKRVRGEPVTPQGDGTLGSGRRQNYFAEETGARRALAMLLGRLQGAEAPTEYAMPSFDRVTPAPGIGDASRCSIALVTSGGIVPRGNPDRIEAANASRYGEYAIEGLDRLSDNTHMSVHGGYDPTYANADPNRVLPLDAARALQRRGRIGTLHHSFFSTVGNATSVASARRYGAEIAARLVNEGIQAVVFTST